MAGLLEYVGYVHIYLGPYRGNPIALYLLRSEKGCRIGPKAYPWNDVVGIGETPNKAAADFEEKWKGKGLSADMYSGPSWEGGIKPEKPAPPKPAAPAKPAAPSGSQGTASAPSAPTKAPTQAESPAKVPGQTQPVQSTPTAPAPDGTEQSAASPASPPSNVKAQPATKPPASTVPHGAPKS